MTNEEKIREILDRHFGHHVIEGSDEWYTRNYQNRFSDLQEMAQWKRRQMIEKAMDWLEPVFKDLAGYNCGGDLINDFEKAMKE